MRLLVDTHIFIALGRKTLDKAYPVQSAILSLSENIDVSVASFWEIAIKVRLGKLEIGVALTDLGRVASANGVGVIPIEERHVTHLLQPEPTVRDPFDRLLLAVAQVDGMRLVTNDRVLAKHPVAARS
ncbi:MAG TPA: PIN domain nuclease [Alphaproteobacteria bacterium]|nr:PIN domain nuclease [Alphaproteobacteria bacterium]HAJ47295.1 PIN domain nuclease [Alphaproteobacteria bacterium]